MIGNPTRKNATKPSPKMAKFVLNTCAACFARQKPVSTSAKPACMNMTRTAPMMIHRRLRLTPTSVVVELALPASLTAGSPPCAKAVPVISATMRSVSDPRATNLRLLRQHHPSSPIGVNDV